MQTLFLFDNLIFLKHVKNIYFYLYLYGRTIYIYFYLYGRTIPISEPLSPISYF